MTSKVFRGALAFALLLIVGACGQDTSGEEADIRALMHQAWDRPDAPLEVGPIAVSGSNALAGWTQGDTGGRALLSKRNGAWTVVLCSGDAIKSEPALVASGVPPSDARAIAEQTAALERDVSPERLRLMSSFEGTVRMDDAARGTGETGAEIVISDAWAPATPTAATVAAGYLTITNPSATDDRLVRVTSTRTPRVEIHEMAMDGSVMRMRPVGGIVLPAGGHVTLAPGGYHLMLLDITEPLVAGQTIPIALTFEHAGTIDAVLEVRNR